MGYQGVDPKTGKVRWDKLNNVNPWGIEFAQNSRAYLENWNKNTNNWLRNYMYLRVTPKGKKPGFRASLATFVTSAFWHGFYPGYYLTFVLGAFIQTVAKSQSPIPFNKPPQILLTPLVQTFGATFGLSSSPQTANTQHQTSVTTTSSPTSSPNSPSASQPPHSLFSASKSPSSFGPASISMLLLASQ
jgi:hypothetical protein